jgi:AraC-like DNA-binding protein
MSILYQPFPMLGQARAQIWRYAPQYRRPRHVHAELEVNLVTRGSGVVGVGEDVFRVASGDLLSWPPGMDHELLEASPDFDLYVIGATPEISERVLGATHARALGGPTRVSVPSSLLAQFEERCAVPPGEGGGTVATETAIGDLWRDLQELRAADESSHSALIRKAVASLHSVPDMGRSGLASLVGIHPTDMSRHFRRRMGLRLAAYRSRVRLVRFVEAVDQGSSLLSAAMEAGFGSYSQCHRAFHEVFGCSPRTFFDAEARRQMHALFEPPTAGPSTSDAVAS